MQSPAVPSSAMPSAAVPGAPPPCQPRCHPPPCQPPPCQPRCHPPPVPPSAMPTTVPSPAAATVIAIASPAARIPSPAMPAVSPTARLFDGTERVSEAFQTRIANHRLGSVWIKGERPKDEYRRYRKNKNGIAAFSEPVQVELMRLTARDAVAVEGALKAELYDRDGEIELSFGVIAEHVLPLRQPGHKRTKEGRAATQGADATWPPKFLQRECRSRHRSCHFPESSSL
jgi:hypothetical protein